jgi:hypothetical protein
VGSDAAPASIVEAASADLDGSHVVVWAQAPSTIAQPISRMSAPGRGMVLRCQSARAFCARIGAFVLGDVTIPGGRSSG